MISAVIPAFNEQRAISAGVRELLSALEGAAPGEAEVLIVDDGSTDGTASEIASLCRDPRVRGIRLPRNMGKGAAVKAAVAATRGDPVLIGDADMATPPAMLTRLPEAIAGGADVAVGSRRRPGSEILRAQGRRRTSPGRVHTRPAGSSGLRSATTLAASSCSGAGPPAGSSRWCGRGAGVTMWRS